MSDETTVAPGALDGVTVVELASDAAAFAGKLLADLGADVVLVEPPGGHRSRGYGPFAGDIGDPERSLWFWHYHTSKRGVVLDLDDAGGAAAFARLAAGADVVLEAEPPGRLAGLGLDHGDLRPANPRLVWTSLTPFGRDNPRSAEQATDLTVLAGGGPVWSCGYDDHSIPPVRGGGNQGWHTGSLFAVMGTLTALVVRDVTGEGQHVDTSLHAAANVTTEAASYEWLVARATVQRQTARHAATRPTANTDALCADGRQVNTGVPPRSAAELEGLLRWLDDLGGRERFDDHVLLQLGVERGGVQIHEIFDDAEAMAIFGAGREAVQFIASQVGAYDFFVGAQTLGLACGIIYSPEEVLADPHFVDRGFAVPVEHPELGRSVTYPGAPFHLPRSPWRIRRRAPLLGEHQDEILGR
ncbi:MAG TPA: CoA transferase [Acidimicrobiales bacterium]|nr:CoA transferase [Acidimicrobiales bacterium]